MDESMNLHGADVRTGVARRPRRSTPKIPPEHTDRVRLRQNVLSRTKIGCAKNKKWKQTNLFTVGKVETGSSRRSAADLTCAPEAKDDRS